MAKSVVLYDKRCGLCKKEILFYEKKDILNKIDWLDIHENKNNLGNFGLTFTEAMKSFHFIDHNNVTYVGVDAFIQIYKNLPGWNKLAAVVSFPGIYHLIKFAYKIFAFLRYRFHGYHKCEI